MESSHYSAHSKLSSCNPFSAPRCKSLGLYDKMRSVRHLHSKGVRSTVASPDGLKSAQIWRPQTVFDQKDADVDRLQGDKFIACLCASAFDSVDRVALWKALRGSGMRPFLLQLIRDLHTGTTARVRTSQGMSYVFYTTSRVRQGCILAPALFCCAIDWLTRHCSGCFGVDVGNFHLTDIN